MIEARWFDSIYMNIILLCATCKVRYTKFCAVLMFEALNRNRPEFIGSVIFTTSMDYRSEGVLRKLRGMRVLRKVLYKLKTLDLKRY